MAVERGIPEADAERGNEPQRLQWAMEREAVGDLARGPLVLTREDVTIELSHNALLLIRGEMLQGLLDDTTAIHLHGQGHHVPLHLLGKEALVCRFLLLRCHATHPFSAPFRMGAPAGG